MRSGLIILILLAALIAIASGWFIDTKNVISTKPELQVPDNIDYYLAGVDYRAFAQSGQPRYQLKTPYMEHFIREDASHMQSPDLSYHSDNSHWQLNAGEGIMRHATETFELTHQARIERRNGHTPFTLTTEAVVFQAQKETLVLPHPIQLQTGTMTLQAEKATLDIGNNRHFFTAVKAIHRPGENRAGS
jgi:LPS export ABC transporter protein LptC